MKTMIKKQPIFDENFKRIILIIILTKVFMLLVAYSASMSFHKGPAYNYNMSESGFLNNWAQYDAAAYIDIAKNGYNTEYMNGYGNYNWFPMYPMMISGLAKIGISYALAAFIISNIAFLIAIYFLYLLLKTEFDGKKAYRTIFFILLFPTTFFFTAMYTESLFLMLIVLCYYFASKKNWLMAGVIGFFASLTRLQGVVLFVPILYMYLTDKEVIVEKFRINKKKFKNIDWKLGYVLLIPLGLICFIIYDYFMFGKALKFMEIPLFNRHLDWPFTGVIFEIRQLFLGVPLYLQGYIIFTLIIVGLFGLLTVLSFKYLDPKYSLFVAINYIIPLCSNRLEAESRYYLILFPAFLALAIFEEEQTKKKKQWVRNSVNILLGLGVLLMVFFIAWYTRGGQFW